MCQGGVALGYQCHHGTRLEHNIEVEVDLELELDFENDFQTEADAKFDKISLLSAEACTCDSGISMILHFHGDDMIMWMWPLASSFYMITVQEHE